MSFAKRFNKEKKFNIDTQGFGYTALQDLYNANGKNAVYPLKGIYINTKGKFADNPVFITIISGVGFLVNVPSHMMDVVREILIDEEAVADINAGKVGFMIYQYHSKNFNRDCLSVEFKDM